MHVGPEPIDCGSLARRAEAPGCGAVVQFSGTVRAVNRDARVLALHYEAYEDMARAAIRGIIARARSRWPIQRAAAAHRTGDLAVGDTAVSVSVGAAHRDAAFAACRFIIDELKRSAPIWKKETLADGSRRWIEEERPGAAANDPPAGPPAES